MSRFGRVLVAASVVAGLGLATLAEPVAAGSTTTTAPAAPLVYTVQNGDYLIGIAQRLGVKFSDLLTVNGLKSSSLIYAGMKLQVPKGGSLPPSVTQVKPTTSTTVKGATTTTAKPTPAAPSVYVVVAGDSLIRIAGRLGVTLTALLTANKLNVTSLIVPGMKLTVPAGGTVPGSPATTSTTVKPTGTTAATTTSTTTAPGTGSSAPLVYVVLSGDSLSLIAQKLGVTLSSLLTTNRLTVSSFIYPGLRLTVPSGGRLPTTSSPTVNPAKPGAIVTGNAKIDKMLAFAVAQLGKPYVAYQAGPNGYDCSGLVMAAFAEIGISLPHYSGSQANYGVAIDWTTQTVQAGDLVFLETSPGSGIIHHVGIAINATQWIQAPHTGDVVKISTIQWGHVVAVRRLITA
jgi:LysM repeat protein